MRNIQEGIWMEETVSYFDCRYFPGGTEENYENSLHEYSVAVNW
jgi:hypothetical protein